MITFTKRDEIYLKVDGDTSTLQELADFFTFDVPGARFTPQFKHKIWDGKIRLLNLWTRELYVGLLDYAKDYCKQNGYAVEDNTGVRGEIVTEKELDKFFTSLPLASGGKKIEARDYQLDAVKVAIRNGRRLLLSPTASGKSLIIYLLLRWHLAKGRRALLIVPNIQLVEQMYSDFTDYAAADDWMVCDHACMIYSGKEKTNNFPIVISTWQSIYKLPKAFFDDFDLIIGDEAHNFKAKSLTTLLHKCLHARFRIGLTGTLDGTQTHRLVLEGLFGPVYKVTTTKALMDAGSLADLKITCLLLDYSEEERKAMKGADYQSEIDFLVNHPKRNKFIRNLALDRKGNTLVLFQFVEKHGVPLHAMIKEKAGEGRKVFFVHGGVDAEDREMVRQIVEKENDAIIVASLGTFSTGINIPRLHNIIPASPSKSRIRVLQSIGRGLRIGKEKDTCNLFDIGDDLSYKSKKNHTLKHMIERVKMFAEEGFTYKIVKVLMHG
jgi:superfamily II DNA or RNA helicase